MHTIIKTIKELPDLLALKAASKTEITDAELQLRVTFADEYKEYLLVYGAILATGIELTGITKSEYRNVVSCTKQEWGLNPLVPRSMYVVENAGIDGIIIWQDGAGTIYETSPNIAPKQIANSLEEYIVSQTV